MDSAIAPHLRCPRSVEPRLPAGHEPAYPSFSARLDPSTEVVVFANFGVQWVDPDHQGMARQFVRSVVEQLNQPGGCAHCDIAHYRDEAGYETLVILAYWLDPVSFAEWKVGAALDEFRGASPELGYFEEILTPNARSVETLYSAPDAVAGLGKAIPALSGEVTEHAYWGSARDRLPISQTDRIEADGSLDIFAIGDSVQVRGNQNVAIIRSGQDWSRAKGEERELYLGSIEPTLREGMDFLRDQGAEIGCYFNRYMQLVDINGRQKEETFGWSFWHSLAELEAWAESHPTHLKIFGTFNRVVAQLNFQLDLKFSHEVYVVRADEQSYTYWKCHPMTGFLKSQA